MNAECLRALDTRPRSFREQRIFRGIPDPCVRIQKRQGALSHFSSSGEIKSSWKRMLPFNGFMRATSLGT